MMKSDIIVEICGDTPLIDPEIIDLGVKNFKTGSYDVVSNTWYPSYPQGIDVQVFKLDDLIKVAKISKESSVKEHVSLYFYENQDKYNILNLLAPKKWELPSQRLQLDYYEDLELIRNIYKELESHCGDEFGLDEILNLLRSQPQLRLINAHCKEKKIENVSS